MKFRDCRLMKIDVMTKDKDIKTTVPTLRFREFQNDARWIPNKIDHVCKIGNGRDYKHLSEYTSIWVRRLHDICRQIPL